MKLTDVFILREELNPRRANQIKLFIEVFGYELTKFYAPKELVEQRVADILGIADGIMHNTEYGSHPVARSLPIWTYKHWRKIPESGFNDYTLERQGAIIFSPPGTRDEKLLVPISAWSKKASNIAYEIQRNGKPFNSYSRMFGRDRLEDSHFELRGRGFPSSKIFDEWDSRLSVAFGLPPTTDEVMELLDIDDDVWREKYNNEIEVHRRNDPYINLRDDEDDDQ